MVTETENTYIDKAALRRGFSALRKAGFIAYQSVKSCGSGCSRCIIDERLADKTVTKYAFYTRPRGIKINHRREREELFIMACDDRSQIVEILRANGLNAGWDGQDIHAIVVVGGANENPMTVY